MKIFYCDHFVLPLPPAHRFPMRKYSLLRRRVSASPLGRYHSLVVPDAAADADLLRVHTPEYVRKVVSGALSDPEIRRIGFPWSRELVERSRRSVGGTLAACRAALEEGVAVNLAGGTHHAFADRGEGFCVFNDAAVAARAVQHDRSAGRVLIIDCDVHQGNGTASIFAGDPSVFTFSIHGANNYPFHKVPGDLDVSLPDGTGGTAYLKALATALDQALDRFPADLAIYLAGADPYEHDRFGRLALTVSDLRDRDRSVFTRLREARIPVAAVMSGGYAPEIDDIVQVHFNTVEAAARSATPTCEARPG